MAIISYAKKMSIYWSVIKANPSISARALGRRYAGTKFSMRKEDMDDIVKELKDLAELQTRIKNSDMKDRSKNRLLKSGYKSVKKTTKKGRKKYPLKSGERRRSTRQTIEDTFGEDFPKDELKEFYS